jgi:hypothetical protein
MQGGGVREIQGRHEAVVHAYAEAMKLRHLPPRTRSYYSQFARENLVTCAASGVLKSVTSPASLVASNLGSPLLYFLSLFHLFPFFFYSFCVFDFFCLCLFHVLIFSILIFSIFIFSYFYAFIYLFILFLFFFSKRF